MRTSRSLETGPLQTGPSKSAPPQRNARSPHLQPCIHMNTASKRNSPFAHSIGVLEEERAVPRVTIDREHPLSTIAASGLIRTFFVVCAPLDDMCVMWRARFKRSKSLVICVLSLAPTAGLSSAATGGWSGAPPVKNSSYSHRRGFPSDVGPSFTLEGFSSSAHP